MAWSRNEITLLIEAYEKHPVLYDTKHDLYYNKGARNGALQEILDEVIQIRPNTTILMIKMKLNTLRTQFNKEMNILKNKLSNSETNEINYHNVSLWCFTRMMFLKDHVLTKKYQLPKLQLPAIKEHLQENRVDFSENGESQYEHENIEHQEQELSNSVSSNESDSFRNNKKLKRDEHITAIRSSLSDMVATKQNDEEWDVFTKFITSEIKTIKSDRRKNRMKREIISLILKNQEEEEQEEEEFEMN